MKFLPSILPLLGAGIMLAAHAAPALAQTVVHSTPAAGRGASINYRVVLNIPSETFEVGAELNNVTGDTITFQFPIWGPGAYDVVNFGSYVHNFTATTRNGHPLKVLRGDTNTFKIVGGEGSVTVAYKVADIENTPKSLWFGLSDIEPNYAFANTPAIFGYPAGYKDIPYTVSYTVPKGWDMAYGLDPAPGKYTYKARDYDELVDAPIVMGKFQRLEFTAGGKPHLIALFAPEKLAPNDASDLVETTRKMVEMVSGFFTDMPYDRYVFQYFLVRPGAGDVMFGALEHRNSSTYRMPIYGSSGAADILRAVIAHEYWHVWSPKRIHVSELGPFDYQRPPHTNSLWFAEGITEYYAQALLERNGFTGRKEELGVLNDGLEAFYKQPQTLPITELSLHVSEMPPQAVLPLYSKGPLLAMFLDAAIRVQTQNGSSLDDAMRFFNRQYGQTGKVFGDNDIIPIMERATGTKLSDFFNRYIAGNEPLPFDEYLPQMGFKLVNTVAEKRVLGGTVEMTDRGWKITGVTPGGSFDKMEMRAGDVITSIKFKRNAMATTDIPVAYGDAIATMADVQNFTVLRSSETMTIAPKIMIGKVTTTTVEVDPDASPLAANIRKGMFGF